MSAAAGQPSDEAPAIDVASLSRTVVVGAGTMGRGIAQLLLQAEIEVLLVDSSEAATRDARKSLAELFESLAGKGRLSSTPDELLARLSTATKLDAAADAQWLFEAVPEDLDLKRALFAHAASAAPHAILATNTSTLSVTAIAAGCKRQGDVVGMHFFNPPGLMRLVEIVPGMLTATSVLAAATALTRRLDREPVIAKDSPGFIVNRLARPFYLEALRLHAAGIPVAQIDAIVRSLGFKQGPFELLDLIGIDVNLAASESVYRAFFEEPRYRPHPLQRSMVTAGLLGRKSGRGFYSYDANGRRRTGSWPPQLDVAKNEPSDRTHGRVVILGENSLANELRYTIRSRGDVPSPDEQRPEETLVVLDTRFAPPAAEVDRLLARGITVAVLTWNRSASAAAGRLREGEQPGFLFGFSFVPGVRNPHRRLELMAPRATPAVSQDAARSMLSRARDVLEDAGTRVEIVPDTAGGVAFRVVALLANEAIGALAEGLAGRDDLDLSMSLGVNYPLGPLEWAERIGLQELHTALRGIYDETLESQFAPHPLLTQLAAAGSNTLPDGPPSGGMRSPTFERWEP